MLAIRVSETTAAKLKEVSSSNGSESHGALVLLRRQLEEPVSPTQKGWYYEHGEGAILTFECLIAVAHWSLQLSPERKDGFTLSEMLKGSQVAVAVRPKPVRSQALIDALAKIEREQEQREYEAMLPVSNSNSKHAILDRPIALGRSGDRRQATEEQEWLVVRQQISAIINIILSVAAIVTAVWWAGGTASPIWKTLVALPLGLLVAIAESVLYARHWSNIEKRRNDAGSLRRR